MSRSSAGESETPAPALIGADGGEEYGDQIRCSGHYTCGSGGRPVPRTDWSQYLDPDEEDAVDDGPSLFRREDDALTELQFSFWNPGDPHLWVIRLDFLPFSICRFKLRP